MKSSGVIRKSIYLITLFLAGSVMLSAASQPVPDGGAVLGTESYKYQKEASNLLRQMKDDAIRVSSLADHLRMDIWQPNEIDSHIQAGLLNQARDQVNQMDETLARLRTIQGETSPWEQKAINRVAPTIYELTDSTQMTIDFLNGHMTYPLSLNYLDDSKVMFIEANSIARNVGKFENYAAAARKVRELKPQLGMKTETSS